jgi:hypothetical protein
MFSVEHFFDAGQVVSLAGFPALCWSDFAGACGLQAILVVEVGADGGFVGVQWAFGVPAEPFNGSDSEFVVKAIEECFRIHPKPHVHSMPKGGLCARICHLKQGLQEQFRMWFFPVRIEDRHLVFLGFPNPHEGDGLPTDLQERLVRTLVAVDACARAEKLIRHVAVTERFVKEVGHDLASSVQATIAKLRNISEGRVTGSSILHKTKEIEQEIWAAYQSADSLGIAVGTGYELQHPEDFDLSHAIERVLVRFGSEATERNIRFERKFASSLSDLGEGFFQFG